MLRLRARPTDQGLNADQRTVAQSELRLVEKTQLCVVDGLAQTGLQGHKGKGIPAQLLGVERVAVTSGILGRIHGVVRMSQQLVVPSPEISPGCGILGR